MFSPNRQVVIFIEKNFLLTKHHLVELDFCIQNII